MPHLHKATGRNLTGQFFNRPITVAPSQQCGNVYDQHDHTKFVFWFLSNIGLFQKISTHGRQ